MKEARNDEDWRRMNRRDWRGACYDEDDRPEREEDQNARQKASFERQARAIATVVDIRPSEEGQR